MLENPINVKEAIAKAIIEHEVELGSLWPEEFIRNISIQANETLFNWLKINNAPKEVIEMFEHVILLERCAAGRENQNLSDNEAMQLTQELPIIAKNIVLLGGVFCTGESMSDPSDNVITWQPQVQNQ